VTGRWRDRGILGFILLTYAVLAVTYDVLQPIWEAPDEPDHFEFARYVQLNHALPQGDATWPAQIDAWNPVSEYNQAPLYYVVVAGALTTLRIQPTGLFHQNPYVSWPNHPWKEAVALHRADEGWPYAGLSLAVHLERLVSASFGVVTLLATYRLVGLFARRRLTALFATAWLAWTPSFLLVSSRIDNDAPATAFSALTLLGCAYLLAGSRPARLMQLSLLAGCLGCALLSKLNDSYLIPLVGVTAFISAQPQSSLWTSLPRRGGAALLALGPPVVLIGAWWLGYGRTFQGRVGTSAGLGIIWPADALGQFELSRLLEALWGWNGTWWGGLGFGGFRLWPPLVYAALAIPLVVLAGAGIFALRDRSWWVGRPPLSRRSVILVALSTLPLFYATIARSAFPSIGLDANARLTMPAGPVVALLVAVGAEYLSLAPLRRYLGAAYAAAMLGLAALTAALLLPQIPAPAIPARLADSRLASPVASFANGIDLLDAVGAPTSLTPGQPLSLVVHWEVNQPPAADFIVFAHLVDRSDHRTVASGRDAIPFEKTFPPTLWHAEEIVEQPLPLVVPSELTPGVYELHVGMYYLSKAGIEPIHLQSAQAADTAVVRRWVVLPDSFSGPAPRAASAELDHTLALTGYALHVEKDGVRVSLFWKALGPIGKDLTVSVQLLDAAGRLVAQQDSQPAGGRLPTSVWPTGQIVQDDHVVPLDRPPAGLQTIVVVYDPRTMQRLTVTAAGASSDYFRLGPVDDATVR
jgi:hypothetical protein